MTAALRAKERRHERSRKQETWLTFDPGDRQDAPSATFGNAFGSIELLKEFHLAPGAGLPRTLRHDAEILTYVYDGALAYENSLGSSGVVQAGEFQRVTAGRGLRYSQTNASRTYWAHFFQIGLHSSEADLDPGHEQKRFSAAERRAGLCVVASPDSRRGSLRFHQDALIFSALLDPGQHLVRELLQGRSAWLQVVQGDVALADLVLTTGDGAGVVAERAVSLTAREKSEILLIDVGEPIPLRT
jgi:redox-sensitive bicupin YhaK (pirin superfamily)